MDLLVGDDTEKEAMKNTTVPSLRACIAALGPTELWKGNCFGVASQLVAKKLVKGTAVYGHWLGPIAEGSVFATKGGLAFCQHGWIALPDSSIVDPTRWVFEGVKPYIFHGESLGLYDEGGNGFRTAMMSGPPAFDPSDKTFEVSGMPSSAWNFVKQILKLDGTKQDPGILTHRQLQWLANLSPSVLGEHQTGVYQTLERLHRTAFIPIDNYRAYRRKTPCVYP
jgi:hypothetical protein